MEVTVRTPPPLSIYFEDDYKLENHLEIFESHMFLTTERAISTQSYLPKVQFSVGLAESKSVITSFDSRDARRQALQKFNACLSNHKGRRPNKYDVGCFLGTFQVDTEDEDDAGMYIKTGLFLHPKLFIAFARQLAGFVVEFSARCHRAAAVSPHFFQNSRYPHFHFLYEKIEGTGDESLLQHYLYDKMNKVNRYKIR